MEQLIKVLLFLRRHRLKTIFILIGITSFLGYRYSLIQDNQSVYAMLNLKEPADRYYMQEYAPDFGKDDFVYVAFERENILSEAGLQVIDEIHQILSHLEVRFDAETGLILWPEDPNRPLAEKIRHRLKPTVLDASWMEKAQKKLENEKLVGLIPATNFVLSLKNSLLQDPQRIAPIPVEDAVLLAGEPGELSLESIENILLNSPLTGSLLLSNMERFHSDTGKEHHQGGARFTLIMAQMTDFHDRDELRQAAAAELRRQLAGLEAKTGIPFYVAGIPILNADTTRGISNDHFRREPFIFLFILLVLLLLFKGEWRYLILPIGVILITLLSTLGLFQIFGGDFNWLTAVLPIILMVAGLSDSIHVLQFYQRELPSESDRSVYLQTTVQHIWKPCLYTTLTTVIGLVSLTLWQESPHQMVLFGLFGAIGMGIAFFATFILFAITIDFLPNPQGRSAFSPKTTVWERFFGVLFTLGRRHGIVVLGFVLVLLPIFIYGMLKIETTVDVKNFFGRSTPIGSGIAFIDNHFRGLGTYAITFKENEGSAEAILPPIPGDPHSLPLKISLGAETLEAVKRSVGCYRNLDPSCDWETFTLPTRQGRLAGSAISILDFVTPGTNTDNPRLVLDHLVRIGTESPIANQVIRFLFSKDGQKTQIVRLAHAESSGPIKQVNDRIVNDLEKFCPQSSGCQATFTGIGQVWNQFSQRLITFLIKSFGSAAFGVFLVIIFFFLPRIELGLLSLVPNILPNLFLLGVIGFLKIPLDMVTAMVSSVALGLIVDDSIHFLHTFKEEIHRSGNFEGAVRHALHSCGQAVVMTSLILIGGFSILTIGDFTPVVNIGKLLMIIILSGLLFEIFLLPALLFVVYQPLWRRFHAKKIFISATPSVASTPAE